MNNTENGFTDDEVIKALNICSSVDTPKDCAGCPFAKYRDTCVNELAEAAANSIKRNKEYLARLEVERRVGEDQE